MDCTTCLGCLQQLRGLVLRDNNSVILLHHTNIQSLRDATSEGCRFCSSLWSRYSSLEKSMLLQSDGKFTESTYVKDLPGPEDDSDDAWKLRREQLDKHATICLIQPAEENLGAKFVDCITYSIVLSENRKLVAQRSRQNATMFVLQPMQHPFSTEWPRFNTPQSPNTASTESWSIAEKWITTCVTSHTRCNRTMRGGWHPTRLLDLKEDGDKAYLTELGRNSNERYVTLSHRWGGTNPLSLIRSNYEQMRHGIAIKRMPQAYKDAITICRRLNIRYLWIDSLCIMQEQDDLSDWIKEAALMHKVYSRAFLNLSALAAKDSDESFFAVRSLDLLKNTTISTPLSGLSIGHELREYRIVDMNLWENEISHNHLNLRGWVLQERLLAPRVLYFGSNQLLWECHEFDATECYFEGLPQAMNTIAYLNFKNLDPELNYARIAQFRPNITLTTVPYRMWSSIVEAYSKCRLTKEEDKLIALSGIAKYFRTVVNDEYVAGMWRLYLASELLWAVCEQRQYDGGRSCRPDVYRAPSFSWASVNGEIDCPEIGSDGVLIEISQVTLEHVTDDDTGLLAGGSLLLKGYLQKLRVKRFLSSEVTTYTSIVNGIEACEPDGPKSGRVGPVIELDEHVDFFDPDGRDDLYCIPARLWGEGDMLHILLLRVIDAAQGSYVRFGLATSQNEYEMKVFKDTTHRPSDLPCISQDGELQTIRIL